MFLDAHLFNMAQSGLLVSTFQSLDCLESRPILLAEDAQSLE